MTVADRSRERVEDRIARLEETYSSFPVNQTTISVSSAVYERARERSRQGLADVYVQVHNDDEDVLVVHSDDAWTIPQGHTEAGESLEDGARREVEETAGIQCDIDDLLQVTILGINNDDADTDPVYRLACVFVGTYADGILEESVEWRDSAPEPNALAL